MRVLDTVKLFITVVKILLLMKYCSALMECSCATSFNKCSYYDCYRHGNVLDIVITVPT